MGLNIKNAEVERLASEVAHLAGETNYMESNHFSSLFSFLKPVRGL